MSRMRKARHKTVPVGSDVWFPRHKTWLLAQNVNHHSIQAGATGDAAAPQPFVLAAVTTTILLDGYVTDDLNLKE